MSSSARPGHFEMHFVGRTSSLGPSHFGAQPPHNHLLLLPPLTSLSDRPLCRPPGWTRSGMKGGLHCHEQREPEGVSETFRWLLPVEKGFVDRSGSLRPWRKRRSEVMKAGGQHSQFARRDNCGRSRRDLQCCCRRSGRWGAWTRRRLHWRQTPESLPAHTKGRRREQ